MSETGDEVSCTRRSLVSLATLVIASGCLGENERTQRQGNPNRTTDNTDNEEDSKEAEEVEDEKPTQNTNSDSDDGNKSKDSDESQDTQKPDLSVEIVGVSDSLTDPTENVGALRISIENTGDVFLTATIKAAKADYEPGGKLVMPETLRQEEVELRPGQEEPVSILVPSVNDNRQSSRTTYIVTASFDRRELARDTIEVRAQESNRVQGPDNLPREDQNDDGIHQQPIEDNNPNQRNPNDPRTPDRKPDTRNHDPTEPDRRPRDRYDDSIGGSRRRRREDQRQRR